MGSGRELLPAESKCCAYSSSPGLARCQKRVHSRVDAVYASNAEETPTCSKFEVVFVVLAQAIKKAPTTAATTQRKANGVYFTKLTVDAHDQR